MNLDTFASERVHLALKILNWELIKLHCAERAMVIRLAISPSFELAYSAKRRNNYPLNFT